jgi:uncharacterized membrane protein (DUF373 family)
MNTLKNGVVVVHKRSEKVMKLTLYMMSTLVCVSGFLYVLEKLIWLESVLMQYTNLKSFYGVLEIGLIVLIFSKVHKIIDDYLDDSKIRVLDLIEISITTLLLEMTFHSWFSISSWTLFFLLILLIFFVLISVLQRKWMMQSETTEQK